ncbi:MAG: adenylate/guanylate cyclase domain-containing protein [Pseudomonadota bacterium]
MARAENLVIMFTDIVGFTKLTSAQSREQNETMLRQSEKLLLGVAKRYGGRRIKSLGDAQMIVYKSPTDAVHCAMAMHDAVWEHNQSIDEDERISIRVALSSGEVRLDGGDVFGEPVNVASRLEGVTPPNEVYFTEAIYLSMNKAEVVHEFVGAQKFKGIPEEVNIYRVPRGAAAQRLVAVDNDDENENQYPFGGMHLAETRGGLKSSLPLLKVAALLIPLVLVVLGAWYLLPQLNEPDVEAEYQTLLQANNFIALEAKAAEVLAEDPENALAHFMQGHISAERRRYADALDAYGQAISKQPELAANERYAKFLLAAMPKYGARVTELVTLGPSEQIATQLAERSKRAGIQGRRDAIYLLGKIGRQDKIDTVASALLDLNEVKGCEDKKAVIQTLHEANDSRALPALKELTSGSVLSQLRKGCYMKQAKAAIAAIEAGSDNQVDPD